MVQLAPHTQSSLSNDQQNGQQIENSFPKPSGSAHSHWSAPLEAVLDQPPSTLPLRLMVGGAVFSLCFASWAWFGQINEVARAQGRLTPRGSVYKVNPTETGKVSRILVEEGKPVKAGQVMMELDNEQANHEVERLEKERTAAQIEWSQTQSLLAQVQLQAESRLDAMRAEMRAQQVEISQGKTNIATTQQLLDQLNEDAIAQETRLKRFQPLVEAGAIAQEQVFQVQQGLRDRQRTITEQQGTLQRSVEDIERLNAGIAQKQAEQAELQQQSNQQVRQLEIKLSQIQARISELQTLIAAANSKLRERYLYAPTSGIVSALSLRHPGEVVQLGQAIAEISPAQKPLILSAVLPNQEAGFVKVGMPVQVKLDAYPYQDYGIITGHVAKISPDAQPDERLGRVYQIEVELERSYITKDQQKVLFKAGQTATAEIVTRQRRIVDLLFDPLKKLQASNNLIQ